MSLASEAADLAPYVAQIPWDDLRTEIDREECRRSLHHFITMFWHVVEPGREFVDNWHIHALCEHLEAVTDGKITRALFNVPPGAMKSLLVNVFWPAWEWGPRGMPHLRYLSASYSEDLTVRDNRRCRAIIASDEYQRLWGTVVQIDPKQDATGNYATLAKGWRIATSVGGVGTGERADRIIVDDPHSVKTAESQTIREATLQWWTEVMPTRLNDPARSVMVVIMQRVHQDDVSGAIINSVDRWAHVLIEMRFDTRLPHSPTPTGWVDPRENDGDLYWPARFPRWVVNRDERILGKWATASQHQQQPVPRGGGIVLDDWWQVWPPEDEADSWVRPLVDEYGEQVIKNGEPQSYTLYPDWEYVVVSVDTAYTVKEENDWSALTVWGMFTHKGRHGIMLIGADRVRMELHELVKRIKEVCTRRKADLLLIEAKASGISVAQEMQRLMRGPEWRVILNNPEKDKVARLHAVVPMFSSGMIYAPQRRWAQQVIDEVGSFPKGKFDDWVDTVSQCLYWLRKNGIARLQTEAEEDDIEAMTFVGNRKSVVMGYED